MPKSHGLSSTPMYHVWTCMKGRCYCKSNKSYKNYGARGIGVCKEWMESYMTFYEWAMSTGYKKGLTIERIDNNKGYSPDNCRWASKAEQSRNRRNVICVSHNGEAKCLAEWSREVGINRSTIKSRLKTGMTIDEAFEKTDWRKNNARGKKKAHHL